MKRIIILGIAITISIIMAGTALATWERPHTADNGGISPLQTEPYNNAYYPVNGEIRPAGALVGYELEELIRVVYLEAGAESDFCIRCVTDVAFNQLESGLFGSTMDEVLHWPNNYTETISRIWTDECTPTKRVREIVLDVYQNGVSLPRRIIFYRNQHYHTFYGAIAEFTTDNVYFSSSRWYQ